VETALVRCTTPVASVASANSNSHKNIFINGSKKIILPHNHFLLFCHRFPLLLGIAGI
jgi:hypothetical protein